MPVTMAGTGVRIWSKSLFVMLGPIALLSEMEEAPVGRRTVIIALVLCYSYASQMTRKDWHRITHTG